MNYSRLTDINLPDSVTHIGNNDLQIGDDSGINDAIEEDGVSYSYIGNLCVGHTFEGCTSLRKFTVSITRQNL